MNPTQFESVGTCRDGEVFEWNVPGWVLNHRYSTKRSDVFSLSRVPEFKFCLSLRPWTDVSTRSVSFNVQLHRIPAVKCDSKRSPENPDNSLLNVDVRFILLKSNVVYKWSSVIKMDDSRLAASFPEVSTYDSLSIQCTVIYPTAASQPPVSASHDETTAEETKHGLVNGLESLLNSGSFSDVTLCVESREFPAHRCVLAARSKVFSAMFSHELKEKLENRIIISDIASDVIQQLLKYVYTDEIDELTPQLYLSLFAAADKYDIAGLRKTCARHLKKDIPLDSLLLVLSTADLHQENDLKESAIQLFLKNPVPIMNSDGWLSFMKHHTELANSVLLRLAKK